VKVNEFCSLVNANIRGVRGCALWLIGVAVMFGSLYLVYIGLHQYVYPWALGEQSLPPPGWDCDKVDLPYDYRHAECVPLPGWHFEEDDPSIGRIAVQDITPTAGQRQLDIDTAEQWGNLSNEERRKILDGKAAIYDFFEFKHSN
jgi:hypothetical protein